MLSFFKKSKGAVLGLDIGTSAIKMVELIPSGGSAKLSRWAIHALPPGVITENTITNVDAVIDVFVRAVARESIKAKRVVSAVCSSHAVSSNIVLPGDLSDNGETIVIGGIYQQDEFNNVTKVPILGDLPIVGNAFRKKSVQNNRTELLIFLTPRIISPKLNLG